MKHRILLLLFSFSVFGLSASAQYEDVQRPPASVHKPKAKPKPKVRPAAKPKPSNTPASSRPASASGGADATSAPSAQSSPQARREEILSQLVSNMVRVEGGTFTMGATAEQGSDAFDGEKPAHQVTVSSFSIGRYEVTQEEWEAVMGSNPSHFKGARLPVEMVSWDDCQAFIRELNLLTGKQFRLPTEAEWEFAARGGTLGRGCKYSGSNSIDLVGWHNGNSDGKTHEVGGKQANELGLYDMSGNVYEWCSDWYGSYGSTSQTNPAGPFTGSDRVFRGGRWSRGARNCRVSYRDYVTPDGRGSDLGLRLALSEESTMDPLSAQREAILDRLISNMVLVEGGTFTMGATAEQGKEAWDSEKPAHRVTVSSFSIGKYEVTQEEWEAVMGSNPSEHKGARLPVENVSWNDCQAFIRELNQLTGKSFRLPTEAEWEFAARGGTLGRGFKYSGSNDIDAVAWHHGNSGLTPHAVGGRQANELGLYDMSGNVCEWCSDWYGYYDRSSRTNPTGPSTGSRRVIRGGCWEYDPRDCRVSDRSCSSAPDHRNDSFGLRLAY